MGVNQDLLISSILSFFLSFSRIILISSSLRGLTSVSSNLELFPVPESMWTVFSVLWDSFIGGGGGGGGEGLWGLGTVEFSWDSVFESLEMFKDLLNDFDSIRCISSSNFCHAFLDS